MISDIIYYLVAFLLQSTLLLVALWVMIKVQGLNYNFLGLLGTATAGGALEMVPFAGHALAVVALYFCITKMTRASMFPDAVFTVVVAYALMFAVKVLAFTALIGDLRPSGLDQPESPADRPQLVQQATNADNFPAAREKPAPTTVNSKAAAQFLKQLEIKGAMVNGQKSSATINYEGKNYVIFVGETVALPTKDKPVRLKLENVTKQSLTFSVNGEVATCAYK